MPIAVTHELGHYSRAGKGITNPGEYNPSHFKHVCLPVTLEYYFIQTYLSAYCTIYTHSPKLFCARSEI